MKQEITIRIDGRELKTTHHLSALSAIRSLGIFVPALCDHDDLEPMGACRLCLIEAVRGGRRKFVTACNYPLEDGVEIVTRSEQLDRHRRNVMELLVARCPESKSLQQLAAKVGVETVRHPEEDNTCILCGLCTRMCESYATSAIATLNRGTLKTVGTPAGDPPADCVGCGGCAKICPTDHIQVEQSPGSYGIWGRDFPLATCQVCADDCIGCGACEEACPFSVPRVVLKKDASPQAEIPVASCRGCGVCIAACPTHAISAPRFQRDLPKAEAAASGPSSLVIGCDRNAFDRAGLQSAEGVHTLIVPCVGTVSTAMLLSAVASGFDGVLVLGRHEASCRLEGSEAHAGASVERAQAVLELLGVGAARLLFAEPGRGPQGVRETVDDFHASLPAAPLAKALPSTHNTEGLVGSLQTARALFDLHKPNGIDFRFVAQLLITEWQTKAVAETFDPDSIDDTRLYTALGQRRGAWQFDHQEVRNG